MLMTHKRETYASFLYQFLTEVQQVFVRSRTFETNTANQSDLTVLVTCLQVFCLVFSARNSMGKTCTKTT